VRYWRMGWREVLWGISWQNLAMLNLSAPRYDGKGNKKAPAARLSGRDLAARLNRNGPS